MNWRHWAWQVMRRRSVHIAIAIFSVIYGAWAAANHIPGYVLGLCAANIIISAVCFPMCDLW